MHRVRNWGSFLQAFALKRIVEEFGHTCYFLDIRPSGGAGHNEKDPTRRRWWSSPIARDLRKLLKGSLSGKFLTTFLGMWYRKSFFSRYDNKFLPILNVGKMYNYDGKYDLVIIGSDEIFNIIQPETQWYKTLHVFGEEINARSIVTYAASFGHTTLADLESANLEEKISQALKKLTMLCVRDSNSYDIIKQLTGNAPELCVDPVFIYDFGNLIPKKISYENYIIVYSYPGRIKDPSAIRVIKKYASVHNKMCISLFGYYDWCDKSIIPRSPFELLRFFANTDCVLTDTYHGTIFSIKYRKNFCTIVRDNNRQKLTHLLQHMNLIDRIAYNEDDISVQLSTPINYSKIDSMLEVEVKKSLAYLSKAMHSMNT